MKTIFNKPVPTLEGKPLVIANVEYDKYNDWEYERVHILTGKMKNPDSISWRAVHSLPDNDYAVYVQGLYKGRYGDSKVSAKELIKALRECNANIESKRLETALTAWTSR